MFTQRRGDAEEKIIINMKKHIVLLCAILMTSVNLFAQTISLEQVRVLALANSRSLAIANLSVQSSALGEKSQLYTMLPKVAADYKASTSYLNKERNSDLHFQNMADTFGADVNLRVTQKIFDGGKMFLEKDLAAIATESARKGATKEFFAVLDSADNAFYAVLEAAATLEAEESSLETSLASLSIAEIRQSNGMINQGDYLKALADKESRENSRNQARRNLALNISKLKTLTGLNDIPPPEQIDFSGYEELILHLGNISDEDADTLYERFWKILVIANPTLASASLRSQSAAKNLSIEKRNYLPEINASVFSTSLGYTRANGFGTTAGGGFSLTGTIPLDFWVMSNKIDQKKIALDSAALGYLESESQLELELQSALLTCFANAGSVLSSLRSLEYTEKHFEFVFERYRLSQSSISDLNEASTLLINSRNSLTRSRYGFLQSLSKLRSLGAIDDERRLLDILTGNLIP